MPVGGWQIAEPRCRGAGHHQLPSRRINIYSNQLFIIQSQAREYRTIIKLHKLKSMIEEYFPIYFQFLYSKNIISSGFMRMSFYRSMKINSGSMKIIQDPRKIIRDVRKIIWDARRHFRTLFDNNHLTNASDRDILNADPALPCGRRIPRRSREGARWPVWQVPAGDFGDDLARLDAVAPYAIRAPTPATRRASQLADKDPKRIVTPRSHLPHDIRTAFPLFGFV